MSARHNDSLDPKSIIIATVVRLFMGGRKGINGITMLAYITLCQAWHSCDYRTGTAVMTAVRFTSVTARNTADQMYRTDTVPQIKRFFISEYNHSSDRSIIRCCTFVTL